MWCLECSWCSNKTSEIAETAKTKIVKLYLHYFCLVFIIVFLSLFQKLCTRFRPIKTKENGRIRSNLRVAQNGKFVLNTVYPGGGTMIAKILDFRLSENQKNALLRTCCSLKLSLESWILLCFSETFPEYPRELQTLLVLTLVPGTSFASDKTMSAFVDMDLLLMVKILAESKART